MVDILHFELDQRTLATWRYIPHKILRVWSPAAMGHCVAVPLLGGKPRADRMMGSTHGAIAAAAGGP